jgi:hypothetical protein
VDLERLTYLDEAATVQAANAEFASDPATLAQLRANGSPSRFNVYAAPGSSDLDVARLIAQLDISELPGVMSIETPARW